MQYEPLLSTEEWELRLGNDVRRLRISRRLTQAPLAERANVSLSAIKYLESGHGSSLATVIRVARVLERTEWLRSFAPDEPTVSPMAMLRARQHAQSRSAKRVRASTAKPRP